MLNIYTWDVKWIWENESSWSIVNKFMMANCVNGPTAAHVLAGSYALGSELKYKDNRTDIISNYRFDDVMIKNLEFDLIDHSSSLLSRLVNPFYKQINYSSDAILPIIDKYFKYCPICIAKGYHAIHHQFSFMDKCIIHNVDLIDKCPYCLQKMDYGILFTSDSAPFCCLICKKSLVDLDFEILIGEWLNSKNNNLSFSPFKNYENIFPVLFITHQGNEYISNPKILRIIKEMFLGIEISSTTAILSNNSKDNHWYELELNQNFENQINNKHVISQKAYLIAFNFISRHIRKCEHISKHGIIMIDRQRDLYLAFKLRGVDFVNKLVHGIFNFNAYVYYLWKRDMEYQYKHYDVYHVNVFPNSKYYFNFNYDINNILEKYELILQNIIKDKNILLNLMIHIASLLLLKKHKIWENHVRKMMEKQNELELLVTLRSEQLGYYEALSEEFLILIDDKYNCRIYYS